MKPQSTSLALIRELYGLGRSSSQTAVTVPDRTLLYGVQGVLSSIIRVGGGQSRSQSVVTVPDRMLLYSISCKGRSVEGYGT